MIGVVIIEDQTAVRELIATVVREEPGFEVIGESGDGHEAYELCMKLEPDFVILDIMLPGMNGAEVLRRFSKHLRSTRVLVFSGYQNPALVRELLQAGAHGFVEKSASLSELSGFPVFMVSLRGMVVGIISYTSTPHPSKLTCQRAQGAEAGTS